MNKTIHFLAGLPRSGSTVLAAILNQNPLTHVSTTSPLITILDGLNDIWENEKKLTYNDPNKCKLVDIVENLIDSYYSNIDKPIIIDKNRAWQFNDVIQCMELVLKKKPKIIATVRSVPDCMASFVRVAKPENLDEFMATGQLVDHLRATYISLHKGYQFSPECFLIIEYEDLLSDPQAQLDRIHEFLELPDFQYDLSNIDGTPVKEDDENLHGYAGMHDIKPKLERQHTSDPKDILQHYYSTFCQPEFWLPTPRTIPVIHDLDLQLAAATIGDFEEGWRIAQKLEKEEPNNYRAAYNSGWYYLRQGQIQKGYRLMDKGRVVGVFGNKQPETVTQTWDGIQKGTILLYLEGGLGDQLHQIRHAKDIANLGNKVVVSATGSLVPLLNNVAGVSAVVHHGAEYGIYHDYWVAGMSAVVPLGFELKDIKGTPYIDKPTIIKSKKPRIGLRWSGNKAFEDQHHKLFPSELMFEAVKGLDVEFISLQRDADTDVTPDWVKTVPLDSWFDTQAAIASCDLIISSCTSVTHMAGAMGIDTWVVTPIMPYFLYAIDGDKTPYYDSFTMIRQTEYGSWKEPFNEVKNKLENLYK